MSDEPLNYYRLNALRRFVKASVVLERAQREYNASLVQAHNADWSFETLARHGQSKRSTLAMRYKRIVNGEA